MDAAPARAASTWARAAEYLAQRVNRRERLAAVLRRLGLCLFVAAAVALAWRALAAPPSGIDGRMLVGLCLAVGAVTGVAWLVLACPTCPSVAPDEAAWALDRIAGAEGRGLAAAATHGPAASEAAFAEPTLAPPPRVRLHPPGGLVPLVGAGLLGVLALLAPDGASDGGAADGGTGPTRGTSQGRGAEGEADRAAKAEDDARRLDARADAVRRARAALNLPSEGPLDPMEVAKRLSDPAALEKALEAAGHEAGLAPGSKDDKASADALARLIAHAGDNPTQAATHRREAAAARAATPLPTVPAARRDLVVRYLRLLEEEAR